MARLFHTTNPLPKVAPSWNVVPTQSAMVVRQHPEKGECHLDLLQWGLGRKPNLTPHQQREASFKMLYAAVRREGVIVPF